MQNIIYGMSSICDRLLSARYRISAISDKLVGPVPQESPKAEGLSPTFPLLREIEERGREAQHLLDTLLSEIERLENALNLSNASETTRAIPRTVPADTIRSY